MPDPRTILITGASSGIGHDAAHTLARRGWRVLATVRTQQDRARLAAEGLEVLILDYADPASIAAAMDGVAEATGGRLDALFNNGAYAIPGPLEDVPAEAMRAIFEANFIGWHDLTTRAIRLMRARGQGRIVNNSSVLGLVGAKWRGAYVASKFAVEGWSDCLRMEMAGTGIDVVLIEPGPIDTPFRQNAIRQFERWIDWERSARADEYRAHLLDKLYAGSGDNPMQKPASAVTDVLIRALEARRPRPRYFVTVPTRIAAIARRVLPARALDRLLARS
ncbi:SDR family NAD(P)-dependent oxidoreductase [Roseivivax isoporae]|uniref:Short-chain dehydrogenase n=1 Tax=Roseivivax isoporae LMG 25204 TaxID=1449351 RepID=X7F405_9RHOB|nr:SDR family NAD(P)-dependent oxidoreductase [Roseivivax isoporae]ETX27505.1 short-chain dehydrogenase [Roseivivax isoporae LMG 25204]